MAFHCGGYARQATCNARRRTTPRPGIFTWRCAERVRRAANRLRVGAPKHGSERVQDAWAFRRIPPNTPCSRPRWRGRQPGRESPRSSLSATRPVLPHLPAGRLTVAVGRGEARRNAEHLIVRRHTLRFMAAGMHRQRPGAVVRAPRSVIPPHIFSIATHCGGCGSPATGSGGSRATERDSAAYFFHRDSLRRGRIVSDPERWLAPDKS
jgi:hypothetical protein